MKRGRYTIVLVILLLVGQGIKAQRFSSRGLTYKHQKMSWVDSVMQTLTTEQRIAQLMIARVPTKMTSQQADEYVEMIRSNGIGGVCFFAGNGAGQLALTQKLQSEVSVPVLISMDAEWGLGMRLKDQYSFPRNARFGQLPEEADSIVYVLGSEIGRQCHMMGVHINFAPVVDINSNPRNPVIGTRAFGAERELVARMGTLFTKGMQSEGVMAVAKHFPGHGDTDVDSHLNLPIIKHSPEYIDSIDLYPFRQLIDAGVDGIMVAHLQVNSIDSLHPSSLSPAIVSGLLKERLGYDGIIITDGLDMKGVTNTYGNGEAELAALCAGNDLLLLPPDIPVAIAAIKAAADTSERVRGLIDYHCRRVLQLKQRLVLPHISETLRLPDIIRRQASDAIVSALNLNTDSRIDSIVEAAINAHAMPGCQVAVMHNGHLVLEKSYGTLTYDTASSPVISHTVYDLASLTKVAATTLAVMKLYDAGKIKLDDKLSRYLPYLKNTDKQSITIKEALSHCARLKAFDALWQQTSDPDSLLLLVAQSPLNPTSNYCYSDFGFMLLSDMVRRISGQPLDQYVSRHFYQPMGLTHTAFLPTANGIPLASIAPTEQDTLRGLIHGVVHDPNAYAMGGVSGHAGLFSNAREVALLMQMLLNGGEYGVRRYLKASTISTFTSRHFESQGNRRALGFDRPLLTPSANSQAAAEVSPSSYGHTGFTGTILWVDPEFNLVYVFLSNRVHPTATPNLLARLNVRTDIQSIIYSDIVK